MIEDAVRDAVASLVRAGLIVAAGGGFALAAWLIFCGLRARIENRHAASRRGRP